jgi:hypothetical protein
MDHRSQRNHSQLARESSRPQRLRERGPSAGRRLWSARELKLHAGRAIVSAAPGQCANGGKTGVQVDYTDKNGTPIQGDFTIAIP